ncbi:MAG TPA: protein kinase [Polyangiaceae bacterium]|nr:protein kinase [Polyangiaceae bacterium]
MGMTVVCQACGARRTLPTSLYDSRVRGKMVSIPCKNCGQSILVDGTVPPPPGVDSDIELPPPIPPQPPLPSVESAAAEASAASETAEGSEEPEYAAALVAPAREKTISHVNGPISERGPSARIGRYALFDQFASGGMATVHFGRLDGAGGFSRVVAIKRLLPHLVANREFTDMLLNEARLAARVRHPNVVATLDVVASKGDVLLVLDYIEGEALSTLCRAQAKEKRDLVPIPIAIGIMQDVLHGLLAIHEATDEKGRPLDLVHRDISPPNVLVGVDGVARVLDFGIAKALQHLDESITGRRMGKMGYMSPEQIHGEHLTQRSDVFSAGIVLWELLCMRRLFPADKPEERIQSILHGEYPRPRSLREDVPQELDDAVMKALERSPEARFATIREFAEALESAPRASRREIGEWVSELAKSALAERTLMVAVCENWSEGPQIPLSSSPFASELPPPVAPAGSWPPPSNDHTPISTALRKNLNVNEQTLARSAAKPPAKSSSNLLWLLLAVVVALIVGYVAHR